MKILKNVCIIKYIIFVITFGLLHSNAACFHKLEDLEKYAQFYTEYPKIDNNWSDPIFVDFYKNTLMHSWFDKLLVWLGIRDIPMWDVYQFKVLLEQMTKRRNKPALEVIGDEQKRKNLVLNEGSKLVIFGDLHGAFHSMVRNLRELKKQKVINEKLKIIQPNTFFVILGNAISKSPYSLELLNILLLLQSKNPEHVIYIRGADEQGGHWKNFSMARALKNLFPKFLEASEEIPMESKIDAYFSTLPDSLVIKIKGKEDEKILLTHEKNDEQYLNDPGIKLLFFGQKISTLMRAPYGLEFMGWEVNAAIWSVFSAPIVVYQKFFGFNYDVFVEFSIDSRVKTSLLTLYRHKALHRDKGEVVYHKSFYNPLFGYPLKNKKDDILSKNVYRVGSSLALTGQTGPLGYEIKNGLETALFFSNAQSNNLIKPIILNDEYVPRLAFTNVKKLVDDFQVDTLIIPIGTPTVSRYLPLAEAGKIAILFPYSGADKFRKENLKNIINFRPSYADEVDVLIDYLVNKYGARKFAFFYQNDEYGAPIVKDVHKKLKKMGIETWLDLPYLAMQSDFSKLVEKTKKYMPDAIGCFSSYAPTKEFVIQLGLDFFTNKTFFGVSFVFSLALFYFLEESGIEYILSTAVPPPRCKKEIVVDFMEKMKKRGFRINPISLEGYIAGELLADAISKIERPITKEKIIQYFEGLKDYKFKGLTLTFNPKKRDLSQPVWVKPFKEKWIERDVLCPEGWEKGEIAGMRAYKTFQ